MEEEVVVVAGGGGVCVRVCGTEAGWWGWGAVQNMRNKGEGLRVLNSDITISLSNLFKV